MELAAQYGRVKGAEWFEYLYKKDVIVLGAGGIGSWLAFLLGRVGCNLYIFDHDNYEEHNMTGQMVRKQDITKNKAEVCKLILADFSPDATVETFGKYEEDSETGDIVVCGFDNMAARQLSFKKWAEHVEQSTDKASCFFMDGRLIAEQYQILCIAGDQPERIEKYKKEYLFDSAEVTEPACTFKQTSHFAAIISGQMVTFLSNWATNKVNGFDMRQIPFFYEYLGPLNLITNVRS